MIGRWKRRGSHLATARLAVRPHWTWRVQVGLVLVFCAILFGGVFAAYRYGEQQGRRDPSAQLAVQGASHEVARLDGEMTDLKQRLGTTEQQLRVEQSTRETLSKQMQQLQTDNSTLRENVAFYESLLTTTDRAPVINLHALHVEPIGTGRYRIRALLVQGQSSQLPFKGEVDFKLVLEQAGKRTELIWPQPRMPITVARFARVERESELPAGSRLREVEIRVYAQGDDHVRLSRTYDVKG